MNELTPLNEDVFARFADNISPLLREIREKPQEPKMSRIRRGGRPDSFPGITTKQVEPVLAWLKDVRGVKLPLSDLDDLTELVYHAYYGLFALGKGVMVNDPEFNSWPKFIRDFFAEVKGAIGGY